MSSGRVVGVTFNSRGMVRSSCENRTPLTSVSWVWLPALGGALPECGPAGVPLGSMRNRSPMTIGFEISATRVLASDEAPNVTTACWRAVSLTSSPVVASTETSSAEPWEPAMS